MLSTILYAIAVFTIAAIALSLLMSAFSTYLPQVQFNWNAITQNAATWFMGFTIFLVAIAAIVAYRQIVAED